MSRKRTGLRLALGLLGLALLIGLLWGYSQRGEDTSALNDPSAGCRAMEVDPALNREDNYLGGYGAMRAYPSPGGTYVALQWAGSRGHRWFYVYDCLLYRRYLVGTQNGFEGGRFIFEAWQSETQFQYRNDDKLTNYSLPDRSLEPTYEEVRLPAPELIQEIGHSPDGEWRLLYSAVGAYESINILRQRLDDSTQIENITRSLGRHNFVAWSPDGRSFLFTSTRDGLPAVYQADWSSLALTRLTIAPSFDLSTLQWSADGQTPLFEGKSPPSLRD